MKPYKPMLKLRSFFESMTEDLFHFNLLLIPFGFIMGIMSQRPEKLLLFIPLLPYFYYLRLKVKKLSRFLFLTWASCLIGLLTPHKIIYAAFIASLCSYSVRRRTTDEYRLRLSFELLCFPLVFLAVFYGFADYLHIEHIRGFIYGQAMAIFILSIIYSHLKGINTELELDCGGSLQSTGYITGFANRFLLAYLIGFLAVLLLFRFLPFGDIFMVVCSFIAAVLRLLFSLIGSGEGISSAAVTKAPRQASPNIPAGEAPLWLEILEKALIYIVNILVLVAILIFIALFLLRLYRGFYSHRESRLSYSDGSSKVTALKRAKRKEPKEKIANPVRRKYYKRVNKYFKREKSLSLGDTPQEIAFKLKDKEDLTQLTPLYEKERYGKN